MAATPRKSTLAILCGGRSSRLGTDKGLFRPLGDESLLVHRLRLLGPFFDETLVVVRDQEQADMYQSHLQQELPQERATAIRIVCDEGLAGHLPQAALTGVLAAIAQAKNSMIAIVPVDQVGVRADHLEHLVTHGWSAYGAIDPSDLKSGSLSQINEVTNEITSEGPRREREQGPLAFPSIWHKSQMEFVEARVRHGALSVVGCLTDFWSVHKKKNRSSKISAWASPEQDASCLRANGNTHDELARYFGQALIDPFQRRLHYLRFSLTEACNLSCTYCLPNGYPEWRRYRARLDHNKITTVLAGFRRLGFRKVRFTGGEPTLHPACIKAVATARSLGFEQIAMTTNGLLIDDLQPWIDAGLTALNVSLDSLQPELFHAVTGHSDPTKVRRLVEAAAGTKLTVKVNTVLMRTKNGQKDNINQLIDWALGMPVTLRFIELMDTKLNASFVAKERVSGQEIEPLVRARGLKPLRNSANGARSFPNLGGPAEDFGSQAFPGKIGFINPLSCNFCSNCNRLRVTSRGRLRLCLFGDQSYELDMTSAESVALSVRQVIAKKPERHHLEQGETGDVATFRTIGG